MRGGLLNRPRRLVNVDWTIDILIILSFFGLNSPMRPHLMCIVAQGGLLA